MMDGDNTLTVVQVDAFAEAPFTGNPAAVVVLTEWLPDGVLQAMAAEHNLSETAFVVATEGDADFELRWFTPTTEVSLCGHATLAAAHALFHHTGWAGNEVRFQTRQSGVLTVINSNGTYWMDFPARPIEQQVEANTLLAVQVAAALALPQPVPVFQSSEDWLVALPTEAMVRDLRPDFAAIAQLPCRGLIVTAPANAGQSYTVVSRFFCPQVGINEDPVTGSAHCVVAPFWAERLGKAAFTGYQASARGGAIHMEINGPRVCLGGTAVTYSVASVIGSVYGLGLDAMSPLSAGCAL